MVYINAVLKDRLEELKEMKQSLSSERESLYKNAKEITLKLDDLAKEEEELKTFLDDQEELERCDAADAFIYAIIHGEPMKITETISQSLHTAMKGYRPFLLPPVRACRNEFWCQKEELEKILQSGKRKTESEK